MDDARWHHFSRYNTAPQYGFGTPQEADEYLAKINASEDCNVWHRHDLDDADLIEAFETGKRDDGFTISENLAPNE
jgi:hypothetical protein